MLPPLIRCPRAKVDPRSDERGFTMALVTVALVAIIGMAALSIDIGTLYQAKAEAQRSADAAALAAARVISMSGITGDPTSGSGDGSWAAICGGTSSPATLIATNVAQQNLIAGVAVPSAAVTVTYGAGKAGGAAKDCSTLGTDFGVNPTATVTVTGSNLPIFFARVFSLFPGVSYSGTNVSATATAEVFNSSNSGSVAGKMVPVQPRCVKPWIVPNSDPGNPGNPFVSTATGSIQHEGISQFGRGVIGENFSLVADCSVGGGNCHGRNLIDNPPRVTGGSLQYIPALVSGNPGAVPSCSPSTGYQAAIAGCDQSTVYACGTPNGGQVDLNENPVNPGLFTGDTSTAVACLTQAAPTYSGADSIATASYPFQILAGPGNPLVQQGLDKSGDVITTSNSIVSIPIYDSSGGALPRGHEPQVTIVGLLQAFISIDGFGNLTATVMNVAGCSNDAMAQSLYGTSPVPVRLITPP